MKDVFIELPAFECRRERYLDERGLARLRDALMANPDAALDCGTFFTLYDKDEMSDVTPAQRAVLKELMKNELRMRKCV